MPTVRRFANCRIVVYADDHHPPHFHVVGIGFEMLVALGTFATIGGFGKARLIAEAMAWAHENEAEIQAAWDPRQPVTEEIMKNSYQPIAAVVVAEEPCTLRITWQDASVSTVDLSASTQRNAILAPLADRAFFVKAHVSEEGFAIEWEGDVELSASQLWRWAQEQEGVYWAPEEFRAWRRSRKLTLDKAADQLGISRRMVAYYESGEQPVPKLVRLACRGLDAAMVGS